MRKVKRLRKKQLRDTQYGEYQRERGRDRYRRVKEGKVVERTRQHTDDGLGWPKVCSEFSIQWC